MVVVPAPQSDRVTVLDERAWACGCALRSIRGRVGAIKGATDGSDSSISMDRAGGVNLSIHAEGYEQTMLVGGVTKAGDPLSLVVPVMRSVGTRRLSGAGRLQRRPDAGRRTARERRACQMSSRLIC